MKRSSSYRLLVLLASLAVSLAVAEALARYALPLASLPVPPPSRDIDPYEPNPFVVALAPFISLHVPGARYTAVRRSYRVAYWINSRGFRGDEVELTPADGRKRLVVIGDSVTEGAAVDFESSFSCLLNRELRHSGWEVLNLGMQGASPIYYAANSSRYLSFRPSAVLLIIFENDLYDDRLREEQFLRLPQLEPQGFERLGLTPPPSGWRLPTLVRRVLRRPDGSQLQEIVAANQSAEWSKEEQRQLDSYRRAVPGGGYLIAPALFQKHWDLSRKYLDLLDLTLRRSKVPLLVASFAMGGLEGRGEAFVEHAGSLELHTRSWCQEKDLRYLPLTEMTLEAVEAQPSLTHLSFDDDPHPNPQVHRILAGLLKTWLIEQLGMEKSQ